MGFAAQKISEIHENEAFRLAWRKKELRSSVRPLQGKPSSTTATNSFSQAISQGDRP